MLPKSFSFWKYRHISFRSRTFVGSYGKAVNKYQLKPKERDFELQ